MNEYVFYTFEGFTRSPSGEDCENIQLLGFECGKDAEEAKKRLVETEEWIEGLGFDAEEIKSKQLLTEENKEDITTLIDYLLEAGERHSGECGRTNNHVFLALKRLGELVAYE